jgi:hypothetical protein
MSVWFMLLFIFVFPDAHAKELMKNGQKIDIVLDYGEQISGWISYFSKDCIVLTDQNGRRGIDIELISALIIDGTKHNKEEIHTFLRDREKDPARLPKEKTMFVLGLVNAGVPFGILKKSKEAIALGLFDFALLGGGVYSVVNKRAASIPLFIGLSGLRLWSAIEGASRVRKNTRFDGVDQCLSIGK